MRNKILLFLLTFIGISQIAAASSVRDKYNFNSEWLLYVGDIPEAKEVRFQDTDWKKVTLPRPFNEDEAFRLSIEQLTDTVMWYRKHFRLPAGSKNKKVFVEFEGVRQGADFYINGEYIGLHENGAMAVGFDLTPYIKYGQENVMAVRIDNNWNYKERTTGTKYQWSSFTGKYSSMRMMPSSPIFWVISTAFVLQGVIISRRGPTKCPFRLSSLSGVASPKSQQSLSLSAWGSS